MPLMMSWTKAKKGSTPDFCLSWDGTDSLPPVDAPRKYVQWCSMCIEQTKAEDPAGDYQKVLEFDCADKLVISVFAQRYAMKR